MKRNKINVRIEQGTIQAHGPLDSLFVLVGTFFLCMHVRSITAVSIFLCVVTLLSPINHRLQMTRTTDAPAVKS